jgi:hypothetical protein
MFADDMLSLSFSPGLEGFYTDLLIAGNGINFHAKKEDSGPNHVDLFQHKLQPHYKAPPEKARGAAQSARRRFKKGPATVATYFALGCGARIFLRRLYPKLPAWLTSTPTSQTEVGFGRSRAASSQSTNILERN